MRRIFIAALFTLACTAAFSQGFPERRHIRQGNREFAAGDLTNSEVSYLRALQRDTSSYEANFNLSDVMYRQGRFDEAEKRFDRLSAIETDTPTRSSAYFNLGNSLFVQKKYKEALEAYKNAMRLNTSDTEAKFNYAYTKKMLENEQQDDQQQDQDNQDQQQDQDQQQNQDQQNQDQQPNDPQQDPQNQQLQPQSGMSREEAEQMLEAIQNSENNTREKVDAQQAQADSRNAKNW